ncbi:MAG: S6e family ribosomal protein [Candidatus Pacearchaeota archaeon]
MAFKLNISEKTGRTFKVETETEALLEKSIGEKIEGKEISPDLSGYEFEITGTSDIAGFPGFKEAEGISLKRVLLGYGWGMHKKPRGVKKKGGKKPEGMRRRKTVRGKIISPAIVQINMKILKNGSKKLEEIFPEQNKPKETEQKAEVKTTVQ